MMMDMHEESRYPMLKTGQEKTKRIVQLMCVTRFIFIIFGNVLYTHYIYLLVCVINNPVLADMNSTGSHSSIRTFYECVAV